MSTSPDAERFGSEVARVVVRRRQIHALPLHELSRCAACKSVGAKLLSDVFWFGGCLCSAPWVAACFEQRAAAADRIGFVIGQRINNVEIVRLMSEGGMGTIYEAEHVLMRRRFAVKVLRRELGAHDILVQRFLNEARATNEIRHPNIVEVIDAGILPSGLPYFVMELLLGENLAERLARSGPLSLPLAVDIALQTASAVHAAHEYGIVHRDLKPENLFLTTDPRVAGHELVKVLDFGIAKLRGEVSPVRTNAGAVLGTPAYMSPEQCRGLPDNVDRRADIYSLGVILYEMLCGAPPFDSVAAVDVMLMQLSQEPPALSSRCAGVPAAIEAAVMKALAKDPADRFANLAEWMAALGHNATPVPSVVPLRPSAVPAAPSAGGELTHVATQSAAPVMATERPPTREPAPGAVVPPGRRRGLASAALLAALLGSFAIWLLLARSREGGAVAAAGPASAPVAPPRFSESLGGAATRPSIAAEPPTKAPPVEVSPTVSAHVNTSVRHGSSQRRVVASKDVPLMPAASAPALAPEPSRSVGSAAPSSRVEPLNGFLTLDSSPWSQVYSGGRLLGSTPIVRVALSPGRHVLTLKNPELGTSTTYIVEIQAGKALSRFVGWGEE